MSRFVVPGFEDKSQVINVTLEVDDDGDPVICYNGIKVAFIDSDDGGIKAMGLNAADCAAVEAMGVESFRNGIVVGE